MASPMGCFMLDYLEWKRLTTKNPQTVKMYRLWITRFLTFLNEDEINLDTVGKFRSSIKITYSPRNVQYGMYLIRDYISYLNATDGLQFPLRLLKIPQERAKSHTPIERSDFESMIALLPENEPIGLQRRLMMMILWDTGMRVGELVRLRISSIEGRSAIIENEKNHRNRLVVWSPETEALLKKYLPLRKHLKCEDDWLFVSFKWRPCKKLTTRTVERFIEVLRGKANLKRVIRPHSFRHGFVHRHLDEGTPVTTIAQMLGHSNTVNVMTYAQLSSREIRGAWGLHEKRMDV